jgi:hypothetical protein
MALQEKNLNYMFFWVLIYLQRATDLEPLSLLELILCGTGMDEMFA